MTEKLKTGWKELFITLAAAVAIDLIGTAVSFFIPSIAAAGDILKILLAAVLVYLVLTRYCAFLTYETVGHKLKVRREIGKRRTREIELRSSEILASSRNRDTAAAALKGKRFRTWRFCHSITNIKGRFVYIAFCKKDIYGLLVIEPSEALLGRIEELLAKGEKKC